MESAGERLKKIRLEKGLSLEEAHKKTKIHLNLLKAIEEDSLADISPVYTKGFIKIYAQFLKVDPKDYIAGYKEPQNLFSTAKPARESASQSIFTATSLKLKKMKLGGKKIFLLAAIILAVVFLWIFLWIGLFKLGKAIFSRHPAVPRKPRIETPAAVVKANPVSAGQAQAQAVPKEIKPAPKPALVRLGIMARESCWLEVKVDGRTIFKNKLMKGMMESWEAKEKIELSLGNAGVVDLNVNGQRINPVGKRGQNVKNILINKDGLSIKR